VADYFTIAEVEAILPKGVKIDDSTADPPKRADVASSIPNVTKQIDTAVVKGGGTAPLTGNAAGTANLRGKREQAYQILVTRGVAKDPKHEPFWENWHTEFEEYLKDLAGVTAAASGAPPVAGPPLFGPSPPRDPWFRANPADQKF
jgi:hypothetical protein